MPGKSIQRTLKSVFPKTDKEEWKKAAVPEVNNPDPLKILTWTADQDLLFLPIYDKIDANELQYLQKFNLLPTANGYTEPRAWNNLPNVVVTDEETANKTALDHLTNGADGILFTLQQPIIDFVTLLHNIEWPYCSIAFELTALTSPALLPLKEIIAQKKYDPAVLSGALFWKSLPNDIDQLIQLFKEEKKIHCLGLMIPSSTPVQEISECLINAVNLVDTLTEKGVAKEVIIKNISFSIPTGTNFFVDISKIKALRILWYQIAKAYEVSGYSFSDLHLHVRSEAWMEKQYEPHSNMLKSTIASMAAIAGGCDALTVYTADAANTLVNRIGRNVSNILREESYFGKVADPTAGSYAIDVMTHNLAQKAWLNFLHASNPETDQV